MFGADSIFEGLLGGRTAGFRVASALFLEPYRGRSEPSHREIEHPT